MMFVNQAMRAVQDICPLKLRAWLGARSPRYLSTQAACLSWSGTSNRMVKSLDGQGGVVKEINNNDKEVVTPLWVHFPTVDTSDIQAFNQHVQIFCVPPNPPSRFHAVKRTLDAAPPRYADFVWRNTEEQNTNAEPNTKPNTKPNADSSAVLLSFQTAESADISRIFVTPDVCLTQITDHALDMSELEQDFVDGVGASSSIEVVVRIIEDLVDQNKDFAAKVDAKLGRVEEMVLSTGAWQTSINDEVLGELSSLRFRAVRQRRIVMAQRQVVESFERDVAASQPESSTEQSDRRDLILAGVTTNELVRLKSAKQGLNVALEIIDGVQERSVFVNQEVAAKNAQKTNRLLTILSLITGCLVPLQMCVYYIEGTNMGWLHL